MLSLPSPSATKIVFHSKNSAKFVIEGLYPGYGVTIANSLRRILLSSLPGMAIIGIKIKDVDHEFSAIPYIYEDVVSLILNLKRVRFKAYESNAYQGKVKIQGAKELKAGDFNLPSELEVINPDLHIATLTDKRAELEITIYVKEGLGYELADEHANDPILKDVGTLKVDSIFTPVVAASFSIENMRVGERTDYNRINLDIETDGSITPREAFEKSILTLIDQLQTVQKIEEASIEKESKLVESKISKKAKGSKEEVEPDEEGSSKKDTISGRSSISHLKLSSRIEKILIKKSIKTLSQISKKNQEELMQIEGIGEAAVKEIRRKLGKAGFLLASVKK